MRTLQVNNITPLDLLHQALCNFQTFKPLWNFLFAYNDKPYLYAMRTAVIIVVRRNAPVPAATAIIHLMR